MKLATILAAIAGLGAATARPQPTGVATNPAHAQLKRGVHLIWDPPYVYQSQKRRREFWEHKCGRALRREDCPVGIIYGGEGREKRPDGGLLRYINVEGTPSLDQMDKGRKMHVFEDTTSEYVDHWSFKDQKAMSQARRARKKSPEPPEGEPVVLTWDPEDAYRNHWRKKAWWEDKCHKALSKEGCRFGRIHQGETRLTRDGQRASYVNAEGSQSADMVNSKKFRVYQDASTEDFTRNGWTEDDKRLMAKSKHWRGPELHRPPAEDFQDLPLHSRISWEPPDAYENYKRLRKSFEQACLRALDREGCDYAIMHKGHHRHDMLQADGTKLNYLVVAAGKRDDPGSERYMRLFENGSSTWFPPGPLPKKDIRRLNHRLPAPYQRPRGPRKGVDYKAKKQQSIQEASTSARVVQWVTKKRRKGGPGRPRGSGVTTRTRAPARVPVQAEDAGEVRYSAAEELTQDNAKRRRVGGNEHQYSATQGAEEPTEAASPGRFHGLDLNVSPVQAQTPAASPERPHAPVRDGGGELDLNFPPTGAASPGW